MPSISKPWVVLGLLGIQYDVQQKAEKARTLLGFLEDGHNAQASVVVLSAVKLV